MNRRDDERERERDNNLRCNKALSSVFHIYFYKKILVKSAKANGIEYGICLTFSDEKNVEIFYRYTLNMHKRAALFLHLRDATQKNALS